VLSLSSSDDSFQRCHEVRQKRLGGGTLFSPNKSRSLRQRIRFFPITCSRIAMVFESSAFLHRCNRSVLSLADLLHRRENCCVTKQRSQAWLPIWLCSAYFLDRFFPKPDQRLLHRGMVNRRWLRLLCNLPVGGASSPRGASISVRGVRARASAEKKVVYVHGSCGSGSSRVSWRSATRASKCRLFNQWYRSWHHNYLQERISRSPSDCISVLCCDGLSPNRAFQPTLHV
jgi:hypothetical protein